MTNKITRPEVVRDAYLVYLDDLRESGATNMFGAGEYLSGAFGLGVTEACEVLVYWMETFGSESR